MYAWLFRLQDHRITSALFVEPEFWFVLLTSGLYHNFEEKWNHFLSNCGVGSPWGPTGCAFIRLELNVGNHSSVWTRPQLETLRNCTRSSSVWRRRSEVPGGCVFLHSESFMAFVSLVHLLPFLLILLVGFVVFSSWCCDSEELRKRLFTVLQSCFTTSQCFAWTKQNSTAHSFTLPHIITFTCQTLNFMYCLIPKYYFWNFALKHLKSNVRLVPRHHCMARPHVVDGGDGLQIWRVAANILNKQSLTVDMGWSSSLGFGRVSNNSSP
jgi:hypothetical protein